MEGPEQLSALQGNNLERLPLALLGDVLLRVAARNAFALSQASAKLRELVFAAGSTTHLWASLDVPALREEGCCSGQDLDASIALVLLQQRIPEGLRMFRGAATDAVLAALQKFAGTLESVSVLKHGNITAPALLTLLNSMGPQLRVLHVCCPLELQPGFLSSVAEACPGLSDLRFSPATHVPALASRWTADPGLKQVPADNTQLLAEQEHRHTFTLELLQVLANCGDLHTLVLPPGLHVCNGLLLAVRRWSLKLQRLQGARTQFASGEGLKWPGEVVQEFRRYLLRQRLAAGLPALEQDQDQLPLGVADRKVLSDLSFRVYDDLVRHLSSGSPSVKPTYGMASCTAGRDNSPESGWVLIDDVAGRRLRIDMAYTAMWATK